QEAPGARAGKGGDGRRRGPPAPGSSTGAPSGRPGRFDEADQGAGIGGTAARGLWTDRSRLLSEQLFELVERVGHTGLHPGVDHAVPGRHGRVDSVPGQPAATATEVLEAQGLDADHVRVAEELEGLDGDLVLPDGVQRPAEAVRVAVRVDVAV